MPSQFVLYENASGYALFEVTEAEEIGAQAHSDVTDLARFSKLVKLKAFQPFTSAENALSNMNDVSEGVVSSDLSAFLTSNLPRVESKKDKEKRPKLLLGVADPKIGAAIQDGLGIPCNANDTISGLLRGVRLHLGHFVPALAHGAAERAALGLAHAYSRAKVKFNVHRSDNMIIQAIALLDTLDKDLNTFAMRIREWYGWHFPELAKIVKDNFVYARVAVHIGARSSLTAGGPDAAPDRIAALTEVLGDEDTAKAVYDASRTSMGMDISEIDLANVDTFATRLVALAQYRQHLSEYLASKMHIVAPNLGTLIGDVVAARLISHAGSLTNLAKSPASTIQILGAEKALFRALKTKGNTPKYGLIFHSSFIGRAAAKNKGRISRYLANKCAIASRIDAFSEKTTTRFGEKMRDQVEDRLKFYDSGEPTKRNADVMAAVLQELREEDGDMMDVADSAYESAKKSKKEKKEKKDKKAKHADGAAAEEAPASAGKHRRDDDEDVDDVEGAVSAKKAKKEKKEKKEKKAKHHEEDDE